MLYIHETPIHFALIILTWILILFLTIVTFRTVISNEERKEYNWLSFLTIIFLLFAYSILASMMYLLPAIATPNQLLPYYLGAWSCVALYAFFMVFFIFSAKTIPLPQWM